MDSLGGESASKDESRFESSGDSKGRIGHLTATNTAPHRRAREGDWACADCGNLNFAKRTRCNKCGVLRPKQSTIANVTAGASDPISTDANTSQGRSTTLFKKGDWTCSSCGNVNWARRDRCNLCIALKPSLQKDADAMRTGKAGGHFDLQDPADRLEHDSDEEEYDEFGRKKRRKPKPTPLKTQKSTSPQDEKASAPLANIESVKLVFPPAPISESESEEEVQQRPRRTKSPPLGWRHKRVRTNSPNR